MNKYIITVVTSNIKYAGTNANVHIELIGRRETSGKIPLKQSKTNSNAFEQGKTDLFEIKCQDIGTLKRIRIGHDNKGIASGWHLKEVLIESMLDGRKWLCECNKWLDKNMEDGQIERELLAVEIPNNYPKEISYEKMKEKERDIRKYDDKFERDVLREKSPRQMTFYNDNDCLYKITISTSDIKYAGTDANVFIKMMGRKLETEKIELKNSKTHRNKFEAGNKDVFEVNAIDVDDIKKIRLGHDNKGIGPGWHVKEVVVEKKDKKWVFPCDKWFDKKEDDGLIERELEPLSSLIDKSNKAHNFIGSIVKYDVSVKTSDIMGAGTDANVFLKIYGQYRKSDYIELKKSLSHRNKFEMGNVDKFVIEEEFFGDIIKAKIKHDKKGLNPSWHLNEVIIDSAELGKRWLLPCNRWLKEDEVEVELRPLSGKISISDSDLKLYKIEVFTGDLEHSGTDANVFITLYGEDAESPEKNLDDSKTHRNKFERNNVDEFDFETYNLGRLIGIRIRHDNAGIYSGWFLDRVEITDTETNEKYIFVCRKWLAINRDDCKIERIIKEINYKKPEKKVPSRPRKPKGHKDKIKHIKIKKDKKTYYIKIYTGNKQVVTGTDLGASIKIFGDNEVSKELKLRQTLTHDTRFFKDQIDLFQVEVENDLGTLYAVEFKFDQCLKTSNDLHLLKVEIKDEEMTYVFKHNQFVSIKDTNYGYQRVILLEQTAQFI